MKRRLAYVSTAVFAVIVAVGVQFSSAQQNNGGHPSEACQACAQACRDKFELCKIENGTSKSAFGKCASEQQKCGAECRGPGGACNPQYEPTPTPGK
jgi:hypothetical protein